MSQHCQSSLKYLCLSGLFMVWFCTFGFAGEPQKERTSANHGIERWEAYAAELQHEDIQESCRPVRFKADSGVPFKGSLIMFHGFTACPQQYFELAKEILVPAGYDVYLPLLPGQGQAWDGEISNYKDIPDMSNWKEAYGSFLDTMAAIAEELQGPVSLGGLSLGGALALWAVQRHPNLYDKIVLFAPFIALSKEKGAKQAALNSIVNLIGKTPGLQNVRQGWGKGCVEERQRGRAGICHFTPSQLAAVSAMGAQVKRTPWETKTAFHIVTAEADTAVDNREIEALVAKLAAQGNQAHLVQYPAPTNHSMLSRFDNSGPGEDMFWLTHLKANIRRLFSEDLPMVTFENKP